MDTNEQKLNRAKQTFERAAGPVSTNDATCLLGEGLAHLADALIAMSRDQDEMRRDLERIKTYLASKCP
jgi:N-acetylglutamate synthase/N-acetylornithine aminotransferase